MNVLQLIDEVRRQVPDGSPTGTRWKGDVPVQAAEHLHRVAAAARMDAKGQRREQFWCDGVRVSMPVLLRLTCSETECPHARQVRAQWDEFHQARQPASRRAGMQPQPLITEVPLRVSGQSFTARPARFPCHTPCPNDAHPPLTFDKSGYDLFENGECLGGGLTEVHGVKRPRIPTLQAAEAFAFARQLEGLSAIAAASESSREAGSGGSSAPRL
jgi:hypothetical protein